jgi:hypothetical protein
MPGDGGAGRPAGLWEPGQRRPRYMAVMVARGPDDDWALHAVVADLEEAPDLAAEWAVQREGYAVAVLLRCGPHPPARLPRDDPHVRGQSAVTPAGWTLLPD